MQNTPLHGRLLRPPTALPFRRYFRQLPIEIPHLITADLGDLIEAIRAARYSAVFAKYGNESFGNYTVTFASPEKSFSIVRDHGEFYLSDISDRTLDSHAFRQTFQNRIEFKFRIREWPDLPPSGTR